MDISEAITARRSIRAFEKRVPPQETIAACLEAATWAPSACNQQPWEFVVLTGGELEKVTAVIRETFAESMGDGDPFGSPPAPCAARLQAVMTTLMRIAADEGCDAGDFFERSLRFFDAPVGVYFVTYRRPDSQYLLSTAAALQNFLLAAAASGLGTCWLGVTVISREALKRHLGIADDRELVGGVALGYPDRTSVFNTFARSRVPAAGLTRWLGFSRAGQTGAPGGT